MEGIQFTFIDILQLLGFVGGLFAVYSVITTRITKMEVEIENIQKDATTLKGDVTNLRDLQHENWEKFTAVLNKLDVTINKLGVMVENLEKRVN